jgi:peptide/nickel transport system substrate-binding protein
VRRQYPRWGAAGVRSGGGERSKDGKPLTIDLSYLAGWSIYSTPTAEYLAQQWRKLGVNVKLRSETLVGLTSTFFKTRNWDVEIDGQGMALPTQVVPWYSGPTPPDGKNVGATDNKTFESLSSQAGALPAEQSCDYWNKAEQALISGFDVVPVSDRYEYIYLHKAQAQHAAAVPAIPTTIRVLR